MESKKKSKLLTTCTVLTTAAVCACFTVIGAYAAPPQAQNNNYDIETEADETFFPEQEKEDDGHHQETRQQDERLPALKQAEGNPGIFKILKLQHPVNKHKGRPVLQTDRHKILRELIQEQKDYRNQRIDGYQFIIDFLMHGHPLH